jgi:hypothetical protein
MPEQKMQHRGKLNYPCSLQLDEEAIAMVFSKVEVSIFKMTNNNTLVG